MLYRLLLFVHVMSVIMWLGAGVVFQILSERATGDQDDEKMRTLTNMGDTFGNVYFGVLTGLVLASGLWMVFEGDWGFDHLFVIGGIAGIVSSGVLGGAVLGPTSQRLQQRMSAGGPITEEDRADFVRIRNVGRIDLLLMIVVVFLMTVKPGT